MALFLGSCSTSNIDEPEKPPHNDPERVTITVRTPETRTSLDGNFNVCWQADDQVVINGATYTVIPDATDPTMATIPDVVKADDYLAVYAVPGSVSFDTDGNVSFLVDYWQAYHSDGSFGQYDNPMVAYSTTTDIAFKNIFGIVRIPVLGTETVNQISLFDNQEQPMSGWIDFHRSDIIAGNYALQPEGYQYIGMSGSAVLNESEPTYLCFIIPARTYAEGLTVVMNDSNDRTAVQTTRNSLTVERSQIVDMEPFTFTEAAPLSISVNATTIDSIDYTVSGEPYAPVSSVIVSKTTWDYCKSTWGYDNDSDVARRFMNSGWEHEPDWLAGDGLCNTVATTATNAQYNDVSIEADTDYYIISGYAKSHWEASNVIYTTTRTPSADGAEVPEVSFSTSVPEEKPYANAPITVYTKNASKLRICFNTPQQYAERSATMSDAEIVSTFGYDLVEWEVSESYTENGRSYIWDGLKSNTTYTLLATATTAGGATMTSRCDYTTAHYIDPGLQWTTISTTPQMDNLNSILWPWMEYTVWSNIDGLTVQKLQGKEFYRVVDPFRASFFADNTDFTNVFTYTDDHGYLIIDATDPENVIVERRESMLGIKYNWGNEIVSAYTDNDTAGHVVATTESQIHIEFPSGLFPAAEYANGYHGEWNIRHGGIVLYINISPDKGASTESFKHGGTVAW